ncbi:hypothetical protein DPMN_048687 [Dreissena polymorpha]|uniref:Uncharacterized protein n=1 Tax=Dreissena polymorpha TaxID=45954 RepID=A0A9D4DC15_DREPO|nr:hypothetical protein DPMN_048687 [Dreissena polymorpha]
MGEQFGDELKFVKRVAFARGFMAWTAVSSRGESEIRIIPKGTKVNSEYYSNNVLKTFIQKNVPRLFPEGYHVMTFHQRCAFIHTSKHTVNFLKVQNIKLITPEDAKVYRCGPNGFWYMGDT